MQGVIEVAKRCKGAERIVVILPDNVRNYMAKFIDPAWVVANGVA
jgi:cysteine synthase